MTISHSPLTTHHLPSSTYRLQLNRDFPFSAARRVLPYLKRLGVTDVYLSPIWASAPGSGHGYDVTDHSVVNPELGGLKGLHKLSAAAREQGLGVIVDFVPNHMGIQGGHNPYWEDVLKHGQASRYAHFFDIAWKPLRRALEGKVLLPAFSLGEPGLAQRAVLVEHVQRHVPGVAHAPGRQPPVPRVPVSSSRSVVCTVSSRRATTPSVSVPVPRSTSPVCSST